ncbi:dixin [Plakobranchus ocellatus]|uniref:Dixin n=1 Tax=Plakobranchus ocellatus TaxID=259542 RepID=A0AAV4DPN1_9GAST|nr:dixin [Plakobranchus ocellatus]
MLPNVASRSSVKKRFPSGSPSRAAEDAKMWMEWKAGWVCAVPSTGPDRGLKSLRSHNMVGRLVSVVREFPGVALESALTDKKQLTAYVAWVNSQLKKKLGAHLVEDLRHDVRDGVALINLIEVISGEKLANTHPAPSSTAEMIENVEAVLQFMALNKVKMHHITTRDIVDGNLKAIMRLVLALAAHYKPNSVRHSAQRTAQSITGIAQGAAAALTEARRNVTRAGHRHRRRRQREEPRHTDPQGSDSDVTPAQSSNSGHRKSASMSRIAPNPQQQPRQHRHSYSSSLRVVGEGECGGDRAQLDGASASSSPASSRGTSPRTSLYLSDPPSSMEGLLYNAMNHKGGLMMTSCESDTLGDSGFSDICDNLKDTHQLLFRLQELLLTGEGADASGASPGEMEGSNPHETISILRGRLLHAEEIAGSLRLELAQVKRDCLQLQGEKAGLQQRLKQQETELVEVKSALINLEMQHNQQTTELDRAHQVLGEREQTLTDVRASCLKQAQDRDSALAQLRGEVLARDLQLAQLRDQAALSQGEKDEVMGPVADLSQVDIKVDGPGRKTVLLSDYLEQVPRAIAEQQRPDLEAISIQLQHARSQLAVQEGKQQSAAEGCSAIDSLEGSIVQLLSKMNLASAAAQAVESQGESQRPAGSLAYRDRQKTAGVPGANRQVNSRSQNQRQPGTSNNGTTKPGIPGRGQGFTPGRGTPAGRPQTSASGGNKSTPQASPRPSSATHRLVKNRPACPPGQRTPAPVGSSIPVAHGQRGKPTFPGAVSDSQTTVLYHTAHMEKPSTCVIHKKLGEIRLRDFKSAVGESNLYHYYFKAHDPEYGTVKEEVFHDDDILPGFEGKIVAWLEEEGGTTV